MGSESRKRNYRSTLRMTKQEYEKLQSEASLSGMTDQDYMRAKLFNSPAVGRPRRAPRS